MDRIFIRDREIATKDYVDSVAGGGVGADLSNYYTKEEVNGAIEERHSNYARMTTSCDLYSQNYIFPHEQERIDLGNAIKQTTKESAQNGFILCEHQSDYMLLMVRRTGTQNSNQPKFDFSGVGYDDFAGGGVVVITGTIILYEDYTFKSATRDSKIKLGTSTLLLKDNTSAFTPTGDYHPATKKYVDDSIAAAGTGGSGDLTNHYTKEEVDALVAGLRAEFLEVNTQLENIVNGGE